MKANNYSGQRIYSIIIQIHGKEKEIDSIRHFFKSALSNLTAREGYIFEVVLSNLPKSIEEFRLDEIWMQEVWRQSSPGKKYNESSLRTVLNRLSSSIESYFAFKSLSSDPTALNLIRVRSLYEMGLLKLAQKTVVSEIRRISSSQESSLSYQQLAEYKKEEIKIGLRLAEDGRQVPIDYSPVVQALENAFLLETACLNALSSNAKVLNASPEDSNVDIFEPAPLVELYNLITQINEKRKRSIDAPNSNLLDKAMALFFKLCESDSIAILDRQTTFLLLLNLKISGQNHVPNDVIGLFRLYSLGWEQDLLFTAGGISQATFINAIEVAVEADRLEWAQDFRVFCMQNQSIIGKEADMILELGDAVIEIAEEEYGKARAILAKVKFKDVFLQIKLLVKLIKLAFLNGDNPEIDSKIRSLATFLKKHNIPEYHLRIYEGRMKNFRKAKNALKSEPKSVRQSMVEQLLAKFETADPFKDQGWIIGVLEGHLTI